VAAEVDAGAAACVEKMKGFLGFSLNARKLRLPPRVSARHAENFDCQTGV